MTRKWHSTLVAKGRLTFEKGFLARKHCLVDTTTNKSQGKVEQTYWNFSLMQFSKVHSTVLLQSSKLEHVLLFRKNQQQVKWYKISLFMGLLGATFIVFAKYSRALQGLQGLHLLHPYVVLPLHVFPDSRILNTLDGTTSLFKGGVYWNEGSVTVFGIYCISLISILLGTISPLE